jgi:flagellar biosynthetic protein FliQ
MNAVEVIAVSRDAIWVLLKVGAPVMLIALIVGLSVSLFQALTQIQEMTLAFVPKIIVIFVAVIALMPFMLAVLNGFMEQIVDKIVALG